MNSLSKEFSTKNRQLYVLKFSGKIIFDQNLITQLIDDLASLYAQGKDLLIIHGAGTLITELCEKLAMPVQFHQGQRITDQNILDIVHMVMMGKVNPSFTLALTRAGVNAIGLSGHSSHLLLAKPLISAKHLGFVGEITQVNTDLIRVLLSAHLMPVIAPLAIDSSGQSYNINADNAAAKIAIALGADKLFFFSDVSGLYEDLNDENSLIPYLSRQDLKTKLENTIISGGMLPKLQSCLDALENGVKQVCILNVQTPKNLINSINKNQSIGTIFE